LKNSAKTAVRIPTP